MRGLLTLVVGFTPEFARKEVLRGIKNEAFVERSLGRVDTDRVVVELVHESVKGSLVVTKSIHC